jgi:hypothetical protein
VQDLEYSDRRGRADASDTYGKRVSNLS